MRPYFILGMAVATAVAVFFILRESRPATESAEDRRRVLAECMSEKSPVHKHVYLKITELGRPLRLANNIGVEEDCMHPLDTHDGSTGQIHIHYKEEYPFTLGDFFTVWGVIFNKNQLGPTMVSERRHLRMTVNGKPNAEFEKYVLKNGDRIQLDITPGY